MKYDVGIVIVNYHSFEYTTACVESVIAAEKDIDYKIYIVDNASKDNSWLKLKEQYQGIDEIRLIKAEWNGGYSYGNNLGIKQALKDKKEYIVIANPDTSLMNNAISIMVEELEKNIEVGAIGPLLIQPDGNGQFARALYTFEKAIISKAPFRFFRFWPEKFRRDMEWDGHSDFIFDGMVAGCFFALRGKDFQSVGLFDEDFFLYNEEDALAYKLKQIGKKCMIKSNAMVYHNHSATTNKQGMAFIYYYYRISEYLILCKYAHISAVQKAVIAMLNIGWFYLYAFKESEAKKYLKRLKRIYRYIINGEYKKANEALL